MEATQYGSGAATGAEGPAIEQLKEQLRQEREMYLRALADFENYRKRIESERASAAHRGKREIIVALLELADSFELARQHLGEAPSALAEGLKAIHRKLENLFEREGITPIQSVGLEFDPRIHEAIDSVRSEQYESGMVVKKFKGGTAGVTSY